MIGKKVERWQFIYIINRRELEIEAKYSLKRLHFTYSSCTGFPFRVNG